MKTLLSCIFLISLSVFRAEGSPVKVDLISEVEGIRPGEQFWMALHFQMEDGWHIYWKNPGVSGLAPFVEWELPEGLSAGLLEWPIPHRIELNEMVSYGYEGEVFLPVLFQASQAIDPNSMGSIRAYIRWLACQEVCVPGEAHLEQNLSVQNKRIQSQAGFSQIQDARKMLPLKENDWKLTVEWMPEEVEIRIHPFSNEERVLNKAQFFALDSEVVDYNSPQFLEPLNSGYRLRIQRSLFSKDIPDRLRGVLVLEGLSEEKKWKEAFELDEKMITEMIAN